MNFKSLNLKQLNDFINYIGVESAVSFFLEIQPMFSENGKGFIKAMIAAVESRNSNNLAESAHALGSSSGTIGANELLCLARKIEQYGVDSSFPEAKELLPKVIQEFENTKCELGIFINELIKNSEQKRGA